jgi:hypothetical protein
MAKSAALAASRGGSEDHDFYRAKLQTARFYVDQVLPRSLALGRIVSAGATSVVESDADLL